MKLVILGSIGLDDIETPVASGSDLLGGAAAHAGIAAGFHLPPTPRKPPAIGLVSAVGNDFSAEAQRTLEDCGLNLAGVVRKDGSTFRWSGRYEGPMDDVTTISTEVNVLEDYIPEIPASWRDPDVLFCANTHPRSQVAVLDQCPGAVITALDSFMLWIDTEFKLLSEALRKVDLAILNEEEVCAIAGDDLVHSAAAKISSGEALYGGTAAGPGPPGVIVKRGRSGSVAYLDCGTITLPAYPTDALVDPTGAGDSFAGGLLANIAGRKGALNQPDTMRDALLHATVTASFSVEGLGVSSVSNLDRGRYHARADKFRRMAGL
ncbi:MAG TPA: hypothetical protein D7H75_03705 [Candidatus Poseidoniales archaeon]|nr:MAG TPA: hypothetical protein D7H75_03705 [Candidatus Poseidoniales archaeon]HIH56346.1 hypothetical protein [Candidatus Thalassarchaeum sp.]